MKIISLAVIAVSVCLLPLMADAKKLKEWCFGNGCLQQTTGWHECKKGELNVCRKQAAEKPTW